MNCNREVVVIHLLDVSKERRFFDYTHHDLGTVIMSLRLIAICHAINELDKRRVEITIIPRPRSWLWYKRCIIVGLSARTRSRRRECVDGMRPQHAVEAVILPGSIIVLAYPWLLLKRDHLCGDDAC